MIKFETFNDEGDDITIELPSKREVCGTCDGKGTHVNPSIDGNGLSEEDFDEAGPEFREDYFRGVYDVTCHECGGRNVVDVVDESRCNPADLAAYHAHLQEQHDHRREVEAERRMGA